MTKTKIINGTISLTLSTIIVKILGLIYKIPIANLLGDEGMGYFNSAYTVYSFFYLLCTAGVPKAIMILVSRAKALNNKEYEIKIVKVASYIFMSLGIIVCILFMVLSGYLSEIIGSRKSQSTMMAIAPSIIFISLAGVIRGYLSAEMRLLDVAVSQIVEGVGKLVTGLCFANIGIRLNMPLELVCSFTILGVTVGAAFGLMHLIISAKSANNKVIIRQSIDFSSVKQITKNVFSISIPITLSASVMSLGSLIDLTVIIRGLTNLGYTESESNALFGNYTTLAVPMLNLALALITPITIAYIPVFAAAFGEQRDKDLQKHFIDALNLTSLLTAPMVLGLLVFSEEILSLLFKNSEVRIGAILLCLLTPAIAFSSILMIINSLLETSGMEKTPVVSMLFGSAVKIVVSIILISKASIGIAATPIGTVCCYASALLVSLILYTKRFGRVAPIISTSIKQYICAGFSVCITRFIFDVCVNMKNEKILLMCCISLSAILYLVLSVFVGTINRDMLSAKYTKKI